MAITGHLDLPNYNLPDLGDWLQQREQYRAEIARRQGLEESQQEQHAQIAAKNRALASWDAPLAPQQAAPQVAQPAQQAPQMQQGPMDPMAAIQAGIQQKVAQATAQIPPGMPLSRPAPGATPAGVQVPSAMSDAARQQAQPLIQGANEFNDRVSAAIGPRRTLHDAVGRDFAGMLPPQELGKEAFNFEKLENQRQRDVRASVGKQMYNEARQLELLSRTTKDKAQADLAMSRSKLLDAQVKDRLSPAELMNLKADTAFSLELLRQQGRSDLGTERDLSRDDREDKRRSADDIKQQNERDYNIWKTQVDDAKDRRHQLERRKEALAHDMLQAIGQGKTTDVQLIKAKIDALDDQVSEIKIPPAHFWSDPTTIKKPAVQGDVSELPAPPVRRSTAPTVGAGSQESPTSDSSKGERIGHFEFPAKGEKRNEADSFKPPKSLSLPLNKKQVESTGSSQAGEPTKTQDVGDQNEHEAVADVLAKRWGLKRKKKVTSGI